MNLSMLKEMSNRYGRDASYVLAGGGNTSLKDEKYIAVKSSGLSLATIDENGFTILKRAKLQTIFTKHYSQDNDTREAEVLKDMLAARCAGEEKKRPSVEALLHEIIPYKYVLHVHPALVNGVTCGKEGKQFFDTLFSDEVLWIDPIFPGYMLAVKVKELMDSFTKKKGKAPVYIAVENHGIFYGGNSVEEIDQAVQVMNQKLQVYVKEQPDFAAVDFDMEFAALLAPAVRCLASPSGTGVAVFCTNRAVMDSVNSAETFERVYTTFSPDHMVYCNSETIFIQSAEIESAYDELEKALDLYFQKNGHMPKIIGIKNVGFFACGASKIEADTAKDVFIDAIKVKHFAQYFGGGKPMPENLVNSINGWEVECYRKQISFAGKEKNQMHGRICIITGGAQGLGCGIAEELAAAGAYMVVADLNDKGAVKVAKDINKRLGIGTAISLKVNVAYEENIKTMVYKTALEYGGLDIFIGNAGIVTSGSLEEISLPMFELVTKINYTAFYLGVKYASRIMKIQNRFNKELSMDIIQINSKSGIAGSNHNFAYAGGKFGGIGLVESFALELVEYNIKVNAVCPGNFLDGPLWNEPEKGLFAQYLHSGKVPGAKTVEDVRRFYESKVPMARGCYVIDVVRAVFYIIEQKYETGQALPVTGGQQMLK